MKKLYQILAIIIMNSVVSCVQDTSNEQNIIKKENKKLSSKFENHICENTNKNLNISILLDLSDRITIQNQIQQDTAYIKSIADIFLNHVKEKQAIFLEDRIQLFFEPNPNAGSTNVIAKKLKYTVSHQLASKKMLKNIEDSYYNLPIELYEKAIADKHTENGANIWGFFKNKAKAYCVEECHRNILIILTDGYLYYEDSNTKNKSKTTYINSKLLSRKDLNTPHWQKTIEKKQLGIIKDVEDLKDLEVLVLGIDRRHHKNPYTEDIIKHLWVSWFQDMGITHYDIVNTDLPANIERVINNFITKY